MNRFIVVLNLGRGRETIPVTSGMRVAHEQSDASLLTAPFPSPRFEGMHLVSDGSESTIRATPEQVHEVWLEMSGHPKTPVANRLKVELSTRCGTYRVIDQFGNAITATPENLFHAYLQMTGAPNIVALAA